MNIWRGRSMLLVVVLGAIALGVLGWMWMRAREASRQQIELSLSAGHQLQLQALAGLQARFTMDTARIAEDPAFVAYVLAGRERGAAGLASIGDLLEERLPDLAAAGLQIYSAAGTALVGIGELQAQASKLERWDALRQVLDSGEAITAWWPQGNAIALLTITPLRQGPLLEGLLVSQRNVTAKELDELFASSLLQAQLYAQEPGGMRALLSADHAPRLEPTEVELWRAKPQIASSAGMQLASLPSLQEPVWLLSSLPATRRDELLAEQSRLAIGLVIAAGGLILALIWIWRSKRRTEPEALVSGYGATATTPLNNDQRRGALLQEVVTRALPLRPTHRVEARGEDQFIRDARYQLISSQGETVVARIYRVEDLQLNRVLLLFLLHSNTPRDTARSLRIATELGKAGLVQHRNLVSVQRVARVHSRLLVTLDDVSGITLRELEELGSLPAEAALLVAKRIAAAQQRLNEAGVLLRQIDPDQVLFLADGAVKLLPLALSSSTQNASLRPPELSAEHWLAADKRSEVAAFGELLHRLFEGHDVLPNTWSDLLKACIDGPAAQRFNSMAEVVAALDSL